MSRIVIQANNLTRSFDRKIYRQGFWGRIQDLTSPQIEAKIAVDKVNLQIYEGEFVGFIGPNGAGKTTTLKMMTGLLFPSSGSIKVLGQDPFARKAHFLKDIALVMGQKSQLEWLLPPTDTFLLHKAIYEISDQEYQKNLRELVELFEARDFLATPVRQLSLGQRMKCELILALLHRPKILFLDEPTIGLDLFASENMRNFLRDYNELTKATIILTSHYMKDVEELCERLVVINNGGIIFDGRLSALQEKNLSGKNFALIYKKPIAVTDLEALAQLGEVQKISHNECKVTIENKNLQKLLALLSTQSSLLDFVSEDIPLEETIKYLYQKTSNL